MHYRKYPLHLTTLGISKNLPWGKVMLLLKAMGSKGGERVWDEWGRLGSSWGQVGVKRQKILGGELIFLLFKYVHGYIVGTCHLMYG